jgi:hypothetical protein
MFGHVQPHAVTEQVSDVVETVRDHGRPVLTTKHSIPDGKHKQQAGSHLSNDKPHAITLTPSGKPMGASISGRNTPLLPISFKPNTGWLLKISMDGSVYGL